MGLRRFCVVVVLVIASIPQPQRTARKTVVSIEGREFVVNGRSTYAGRSYDGMNVQGLLFNSRMVQGIFDDRNPETRGRWNYPDGPWDPERNTAEFLGAMADWRAHGLLGFTINLQGGMPKISTEGKQPWHNSALTVDGELKPEYLSRLDRILLRADELGDHDDEERERDPEPDAREDVGQRRGKNHAEEELRRPGALR